MRKPNPKREATPRKRNCGASGLSLTSEFVVGPRTHEWTTLMSRLMSPLSNNDAERSTGGAPEAGNVGDMTGQAPPEEGHRKDTSDIPDK